MRGHGLAMLAGGAAGILSANAIEAALARPYHGYHRGIHQKAAALAHGLVSSHGFVDGNKRTAFYVVELLINRSGYDLVEQQEKIAELLVDVARGDMDVDELACWFRERIVRSKDLESN